MVNKGLKNILHLQRDTDMEWNLSQQFFCFFKKADGDKVYMEKLNQLQLVSRAITPLQSASDKTLLPSSTRFGHLDGDREQGCTLVLFKYTLYVDDEPTTVDLIEIIFCRNHAVVTRRSTSSSVDTDTLLVLVGGNGINVTMASTYLFYRFCYRFQNYLDKTKLYFLGNRI